MKQIQTKGYEEKFISQEFKVFFLLEFTKQLIKNSAPSEILELTNVLKDEEKEEKSQVKQLIKRKEKIEKKPLIFSKRSLFKPRRVREIRPSILRIPESRFPERLNYIKPTATDIQIDLEKLNPLIKDPAIRIIACEGSDKNIIVGGSMGRKKTNIILGKDEINEIIKKFSEISRIPITQGVFRVAVGKFVLSAIVSDVIDSKFIIKKIVQQKQGLVSNKFRKF